MMRTLQSLLTIHRVSQINFDIIVCFFAISHILLGSLNFILLCVFVWFFFPEDLLLEYTKYRKAVQQRATSTVSKEIKSLMDCLKALNRSGNLEIILKVGWKHCSLIFLDE